MTWLALQLQFAVECLGSLAHGLQPEVARAHKPRVKSTAIIGDRQHNVCRVNLEREVNVNGFGVFPNVDGRIGGGSTRSLSAIPGPTIKQPIHPAL